eukprot:744872-Hanusia_phi.AAC.1
MSGIKFSFSLRGIAPGVSEEDLQTFFSQFGTVVSVKQVPVKPGMPTGAAYVNFSSGEVSAILGTNNTAPPFNQGTPISIRQQANFVARAVAAVKEIQFSVSVRGVHWTVGQDALARQFSQHAKIHSIKMAEAAMHHRLATRAAYINFAEGDKAAILAYDGKTPEWNEGCALSVREQDANVARAAAAKPITAKMQLMEPAVPDLLLSKKRKEELTATSLSDEDEEEEGGVSAAASSSNPPPPPPLTGESAAMAAESGEEALRKENKPAALYTRTGGEKKNSNSAERREEKKVPRSDASDRAVAVSPEALRGGLLSSSMRRALQQEQQQQLDGPGRGR